MLPAPWADEPIEADDEIDELQSLKGMLAKALATPSSSPLMMPQKDMGLRSLSKTGPVYSNCSLSTMAPEDDIASQCGSNSGLKRMHHVWSSGSVSSMVSEFNIAEDGEMEFELDIEAGAAAALKDERLVPQLPSILQAEESAGDRGKTTPEMSHGQVPRPQDMTEMYNSSKDAPPTTMMIRNIPGRYQQNDLMMDLKDLGFAGTYDFLYMPMDKATSANVGYAFVNFVEPIWAAKCLRSFENYRFARHQRTSNKLASVSVAHLQGLEKNLLHYQNSAVNMSKEKRRRPVVMANIAKICR
jgi:hypothetical protein